MEINVNMSGRFDKNHLEITCPCTRFLKKLKNGCFFAVGRFHAIYEKDYVKRKILKCQQGIFATMILNQSFSTKNLTI